MLVARALQSAAPLQPAGKWVADYRNEGSTISRPLGDVKAPRLFGFRPRPTSVTGQVVMTLPGGGGGRPREGSGVVTLMPASARLPMRRLTIAILRGGRARRFEMVTDFWHAVP